MRGIVILIVSQFFGFVLWAQNDMAFRGHDPKKDANLNPFVNKEINPDSNLSINPSSNYNMNPIKEISLNPTQNSSINPVRCGAYQCLLHILCRQPSGCCICTDTGLRRDLQLLGTNPLS